MDMTKDYLNRILELDEPHQIMHGGRTFVDKNMYALPSEPVVKNALCTATLSSIVDYIKQAADAEVLKNGRLIIHVVGNREVTVHRELNLDKVRDHLISSEAIVSSFPFGHFMDMEQFIINLQSSFVQDENTDKLLQFVASVRQDTNVEQNDDGISQRVTTRAGILLNTASKVPNPITLRPFRTFSEVEQPKSTFVFRIKTDERMGVTMALFEADGSAWKHAAICSIRDYFTEKLEGQDVIILA